MKKNRRSSSISVVMNDCHGHQIMDIYEYHERARHHPHDEESSTTASSTNDIFSESYNMSAFKKTTAETMRNILPPMDNRKMSVTKALPGPIPTVGTDGKPINFKSLTEKKNNAKPALMKRASSRMMTSRAR